MDGFTISDAKRNGLKFDEGSGSFVNCQVVNNLINGIYHREGVSLSMTDCLISNNGDDGIYLRESGGLSMTDCLISNNGNDGIRLRESGGLSMTNCEVSYNQNNGVFTTDWSGDVELKYCTIVGNGAKGARVNGDLLILDQCRFSYNAGGIASASLSDYGGFQAASLHFNHCIFEYNTISTSGGGNLSATNIQGDNSLFIGNTASKGGVISGTHSIDVTNCTFVNNSATSGGSVIYSSNGYNDYTNLQVSNCIFWGNHSSQSVKTIEINGTDLYVDIAYNLIDLPDCESFGDNIICGDGNIFNANDPFISIGDENFQLSDNSQAVNTGSNHDIDLGSFDLNGQPRIQNGFVDLGAYEQSHCLLSFTSQTEVDDFLINNPTLDTLNCDVHIHSEDQDPIFDLNGFNQINKIGGYLWIERNDSITSLAGLENLTEVGGNLQIDSNQYLTNIDALGSLKKIGYNCLVSNNENLSSIAELNNLTEIGGSFILTHNNTLTSVVGLDSLETIKENLDISKNNNLSLVNGFNSLSEIGGHLMISENDSLHSFIGFNNLNKIDRFWELSRNQSLSTFPDFGNLSHIGEHLYIYSNSSLNYINGLNNLDSVGSYIYIRSNDSINTINGFQNLAHLGGQLSIRYNSNLDSIEGFNNLTTIESNFYLASNSLITSINGFQNLHSVGGFLRLTHTKLTDLQGLNSLIFIGGHLTISNNGLLETCNAPFVCNYLLSGESSTILNNAPGCNSDLEILDTCEEVGKINYPLFYDINQDGILDNGEPFLSCASALIEPGAFSVYGNSTNGGEKYLDLGAYSISYNQTTTPIWELTTGPASYDFTLDAANLRDTVYFGLHPAEFISDVVTSTSNSLARCNEFVTFHPMAANNGTTIADGILWFTIDENILDINFIDHPDSIVSPNRYGWFFTNLFPDAVLKKEISLQLPGPPDFPIGNTLNFETEIYYTDVNGPNGFDEHNHSLEVQCSYDPNDKLVAPIYPNNYALIGENLVYTIRFQNTGNAEAYDVVIKDELDPNLDLTTFLYITSSHESVLSTYLEGNIVTFDFRDIFLPDSTTNFDESQGYVMYSIRANDTIPENTNINNTANIFFDFNPAVVTNTTENLMIATFDFDEDGFELWNDCDDNNPLVNFNMIEIPYNGLDDDCNTLTLDDDLDGDGFLLVDDCDDNNTFVNSEAMEIVYNGLDDDCNEMTLDDDLDQDGFALADDCDDEDPLINTTATEIPNNGIDEDCDGEDLISIGMEELTRIEPQVFPNPTLGLLQVLFPTPIEGTYSLNDINGKLLLEGHLDRKTVLDLSGQTEGVYLLLLKSEKGIWVERVMKL